MDKPIEKHYTNGEITVIWKSERCIHSAVCRKGLRHVFDPNKRPWVNMNGGTTDAIVAQVDQCPSGALTWKRNHEEIAPTNNQNVVTKIEVIPNGPLRVHGDIEVTKSDGTIEKREKITSLCRCGQSANKPFCDGTHRRIEWKEA